MMDKLRFKTFTSHHGFSVKIQIMSAEMRDGEKFDATRCCVSCQCKEESLYVRFLYGSSRSGWCCDTRAMQCHV